MVRIGSAQPRNRMFDYRLTPSEAMAEIENNLNALEEIVHRAGEAGCDVLALPEDTLGMLRWESANEDALAEVLPKAVHRMLDRLGRAAAAHSMYLVCCNNLVEADGARYNTAFFLGRDGKEIGRYHKVNMPIHELDRKRGDHFPVFPTPDLGNVGMLICYDMVFPEATRCLALAGAHIIFNPTLGGAAVGDAEINRAAFRTRAVENYVYLVVSQRGSGSLIISPQGKVLAEGKGLDTIAIADVDIFGGREGGDAWNHQKDMRTRLFRERSPEAFGILSDPNPPILTLAPETITIEEAVRISAGAFTLGDTRFQEADRLRREGKREEAIRAFECLKADFPHTWIDRVGQERLDSLRSGEVYDAETTPDGWQATSPREEIRPNFSYVPTGGRDGRGSLLITADQREGLHGRWQKTLPVQGGRTYRFHAVRRVNNVASPRRSAVVRILWQDEKGAPVPSDRPAVSGYLKGWVGTAEPEFPGDGQMDANGWTEVSGLYRAPEKATQAQVELWLRWAPGGRIEWSETSLEETAPSAGRKVRLAAIHYRPDGKTPAENCRQFAPLIAEAAQQKADLVVLPETLTYYHTGRPMVEAAESIPGPSTDYFGELARQHNLYIVAGLVERENHLAYNVAVLIGPDGSVVGKYRKVCLPRSEVEAGIAPGDTYPVFPTRFGKVGMMVCYDGFFPEVARQLSNNGAEVIAWPVWGCNPLLAAARACENHVYVVSSTYEDISRNWMVTAVFDHEGKTLACAEQWGTVTMAEVDLDARVQWNSLGDFKAELYRHRPL